MAKRVKRYRVSSGVMATLVGKLGELIVNTTNNSVHVHDEITAGGFELGRADVSNVQAASVLQAGKMTIAQATELIEATADIVSNDLDIADNVTNISANTSNIATNVSAILLRASKIAPSTANNVATLSASGELQDSGKLVTDMGLSANTKITVYQNAAPVGWVIDTANDNKSIRIVSSGGGVTGGATGFNSVFGSGKNAGDTTLTADQSGLVGHGHTLNNATNQRKSGGNPNDADTGGGNQLVTITVNNVASAPAVDSHNHGLSLDLAYMDMMVVTKAA